MFCRIRLAIQRTSLLLLAWTFLTAANIRSKRGDGRMGRQLNVTKMMEAFDVNNDNVVSVTEYNNVLNQYDTNNDNLITRCEWTSRMVDTYDDSKLSALSYFDLFDVNGDSFINPEEINVMGYDADGDGVVSATELRDGIEKETGLSKKSNAYLKFERLSSVKVQTPPMKSTLKTDLIKKDADNDTDGTITRTELQEHYIVSYDKSLDYKVTRCEFVTGSVERYADTKDVASQAFDNMDSNNNNYIDVDDIKLSKFDENGDGKLTADEFESAVKKADWAAFEKVYPNARTNPPPASVGTTYVVTPYLGLLFSLTAWLCLH